MFDIITFGSAAQDIIVRPKKLTNLNYKKEASLSQVCFPTGGKIDVEEFDFYSGGGGTNTAATFALQGFKAAFCGTIGDDVSGQEIITELKELKVNTGLVRFTREKLTNHSIVISNDGQDRTILAYRGAAELMDKKQIPWGKLKAKWLYLAPLSGLLAESFGALVDFANNKQIKIAVNPGIAQLSMPNFTEIAKEIDVLILNREEASYLAKIPYEQEKELFSKINEMCPGVTVMTKGGAGVVVSDGKYLYSALPPEGRLIVDTLGAGDAFGSGFVAEFMRTANIEKAVQFGMANSVGNLTQIGAKTGLLKKGEPFEPVNVVRAECDNYVCLVK